MSSADNGLRTITDNYFSLLGIGDANSNSHLEILKKLDGGCFRQAKMDGLSLQMGLPSMTVVPVGDCVGTVLVSSNPEAR